MIDVHVTREGGVKRRRERRGKLSAEMLWQRKREKSSQMNSVNSGVTGEKKRLRLATCALPLVRMCLRHWIEVRGKRVENAATVLLLHFKMLLLSVRLTSQSLAAHVMSHSFSRRLQHRRRKVNQIPFLNRLPVFCRCLPWQT